MASKGDSSICAICCETFSKPPLRTYGYQSDFSNLFHLQKLFDSKVIKDRANTGINSKTDHLKKCEGEERNRRRGRKPKSLSASSEPQISIKLNTVICPKCISCLSSSLTKKSQLATLEVEVRQLQMKLLKLLNDLQGSINKFNEEVKKMEGIVQGSHSNVKNLDEFFDIMDGDSCGERGGESVTLKDVIQLRGIMESVVSNLVQFSSQLVVQKMTSTKQPKNKKIVETTAIIGNSDTISSSTSRKETIVPEASYPNTEEGIISEQCESSNEHVKRDETVDTHFTPEIPQDDDDNRDDNVDIDEESNQRKQSVIVHLRESENKRPTRSRRRKQYSKIPLETSSESEEAANNASDEDEYHPSSSKKKNDKKTDGQLLPDFTRMSIFKKTMIKSIMKRESIPHRLSNDYKNWRRKRNLRVDVDTSSFDDVDPRKTHFITYNSNTDTLSLDGIEIVIDEQEECLKCSKCDFKSQKGGRPNGVLRDLIYSHIFAYHLNLLSCPYCPANLTTYQRFRTHILGHGNQFACDVCQKPFMDSYILRDHKWSHLNEEERAEAIKNGKQPPKKYVSRLGLEKKFQCTTCGKGFFYMSLLQKHEKVVHQDEKRHLCSECGKRFAEKGHLADHLKRVCCPEKPPRHVFNKYHCDQCPKMFPRPNQLKEHKAVFHSTEPPPWHKCSLCEKTFRMRASCKAHEKTHSDARPFSCRKECGATFKNRSNCQRHEKQCGNKN